MSWITNLQRVTRLPKSIRSVTIGSSPYHSLVNKQQKSGLFTDKEDIAIAESLVSKRKMHWRLYGLYRSGASFCSKNSSVNSSRKFGYAAHTGPSLSRDFLVQSWVADDKMKRTRVKRKQKSVEDAIRHETGLGTKGLHGSSVIRNEHFDYKQVASKSLEHASPEEAWIAPLLSRSNLIITRDIEWANLTLGFEQENRYAIVDVNNQRVPAGFIRVQSNVLFRLFLQKRRPFVAIITDAYGNELFRVRRPFWWLTSSVYAEVGGKEVGVVHRRRIYERSIFERRIYDLYLGNEQFAVVENPGFRNWTFTLKGINGEVLAVIDRDWRGFGFKAFTDAGQYVIQFEAARPLTLLERAVTVALAVSLDNDYFSRHGGWGIPYF